LNLPAADVTGTGTETVNVNVKGSEIKNDHVADHILPRTLDQRGEKIPGIGTVTGTMYMRLSLSGLREEDLKTRVIRLLSPERSCFPFFHLAPLEISL
jgi:hypothetical protein